VSLVEKCIVYNSRKIPTKKICLSVNFHDETKTMIFSLYDTLQNIYGPEKYIDIDCAQFFLFYLNTKEKVLKKLNATNIG